jgi:hypothetical protein
MVELAENPTLQAVRRLPIRPPQSGIAVTWPAVDDRLIMRIILRLIAAVTLLSVIATLVFVLAFWRRGGMLPLVSTGPFGLLTALGWLITLVVGPPAVVLLWKQNNAGRIASIIFWASICLYYVLGLAFFRTPATRYGSVFLCIMGSMIPLALLVSRQAKIACKSRTMPPYIPR